MSQEELFKRTLEEYEKSGSILQAARMLHISTHTAKKILITLGAYEDDTQAEIQKLSDSGMTKKEIAKKLGISVSWVCANLPYEKGSYLKSDKTDNALKIKKWRESEVTIKGLRKITGLSQIKFCEKFDIPRRTLEDWETGKHSCPRYVLKLIEDAVKREYE